MKAAVLHGYGEQLKTEDIPEPHPTGNEVVIKVVGCGVCRTDVHLSKGRYQKYLPVVFPHVLGHSVSGIIHETGESVPEQFGLGDPVIIYSYYCEYEDIYSYSGEYYLCGLRSRAGMGKYFGGYAEYMLVPHYKYLVNVEGLDYLVAASILTDPGLRAYSAVKKIFKWVDPGMPVGILGLSIDALMAAKLLSKIGLHPTIILDHREEWIDNAMKVVGINDNLRYINTSEKNFEKDIMDFTRGEPLNALIYFYEEPEWISEYIDFLARGSPYIISGEWPTGEFKINILRFIQNGYSLISNHYGSYSEMMELVSLARRGLVKYRDLVEYIDLNQVNDAFRRLEEGSFTKYITIKFD